MSVNPIMSVNTITFDLEIYPYHIDFSGLVGPIAYAEWMEIAWFKLLEAIALPRQQFANNDLWPILTQTAIEYSQPLRLGDRLRVETGISQLDGALVGVTLRFYHAETGLVAEASQNWTFVDEQRGRPQALTPDITARFQPYRQSPNP
jgi:acyl-CoA thioester hydrolase